jgi:tetratricopeptide (TPR) repeat protein
MAADPAWLEQDFISDSYGALLHNLGLAHLINFGYEQALEYFDQVLSFRPQETRTLKAKGDTLVLLGRLVEAGDLFKTACQSATDRSLFYAAIADVCLQLDEIPLALQPVEKGLRLNPASRACLLGKAKILARLGQMAESEKVLAQAVAGLKTAPPPSLQEKFLIEGLILMVEAENCFNRGELPESIQLGRQALEAFRKQGDDISLEEIEARCRLVYYLKMSGVEEHLAALKAAEAKDRAASTKTVLKYYHLAYAEALAIIDRVPASPLGRKALIGPAAFLHKDEEVLDQVKWLINYPENITADVLATLLIIIRWAEGDIKMRTETLLEQVLVEMNKIMSPETVQAKMDSARQLAGTIQKP